MVKGVIRIETRMSDYGNEPAIYRITEQKQRYLMVAFEEADEAREAGKAIAKLLKVRFKDHIYSESKLEGVTSGRMSATASNLSTEPKLFTRPKRVMGAEKDCIEMLTEGKLTEREIKCVFADKYIQAGHRETKAKELAGWVLKAAKKKI